MSHPKPILHLTLSANSKLQLLSVPVQDYLTTNISKEIAARLNEMHQKNTRNT